MRQRPCVGRRLADLEQYLAHSRAGKNDRLLRPIGRPNYYSQYMSVWDNRGADIAEHLPRDFRIRYGELYDEFRNNDVVRVSERDVWRQLAQFDDGEPLDHADRRHLRQLLTLGEGLNKVTSGNYDYILRLARPLDIRPIGDANLVHVTDEDSFCKSLYASE